MTRGNLPDDPELEAERLIADSWSRIMAEEASERSFEVADRIRSAWGKLTITDRLRSLTESDIRIDVSGAGQISGRLETVEREWIGVHTSVGRCYLAIAAINSISSLGARNTARTVTAEPEPAVPSTLSEIRNDWTQLLRTLAIAGRPVTIVRADGYRNRASIIRVGADHFDAIPDPPTANRNWPMQQPGFTVVAISALAAIYVH